MASSDNLCITLLSIPGTPFLLGICPFLEPWDLFHLRLTCRRTFELMHEEEESQELWKLMLRRDFGIQSDFERTLAIAPLSDTVHSIFGVDPTGGGAIQQVANPFESWKHWIKCSQRFHSFQGTHSDCPLDDQIEQRKQEKMLMNGPYFLRAAILWGKIFSWLEAADQLGTRIKTCCSQGMFYMNWDKYLRDRPGVKACQAVYAFCGPNQNCYEGRVDRVFDGLFGGYGAYDFVSCTHFSPPSVLATGKFVIARDVVGAKGFRVDCNTGMIELYRLRTRTSEIWPAMNAERTSDGLGIDAVLCWLEEYAERLSSGRIGVGRMGSIYKSPSILLYPRFPLNEPLTTTEGVQTVSRAVTRGIEVIASAIYAPHTIQIGWGFIYNIRIRLLTPQDDGYVSASDRGFETCQLQTPHWQIRNFETGHVERVDGDGVIGKYPILREGGYIDEGASHEGTFSYTSCTGPMQGSFSGHMRFIPGTLRRPTGLIQQAGPSFEVELRPFALDNNPDFLY